MPKIKITYPDGTVKEFEQGSTPKQIAASIGKRLAADALAAKVNDKLWDLERPIEKDSKLQILTWEQPEGKAVFRHSTAHILAHAIKRLYPDSKNTIGPSLEDGFYYDFDDLPISETDFPKIEEEMRKIVQENHQSKRRVVTIDDVKKLFQKNLYKLEMAKEFKDAGFELTVYYHGEDFWDLCEGPHLASTGLVKAVKLMKLAGAYWRGDEKNKQLTRIYGTSFPSEKELKAHLDKIAEAEKRDHRKLGKELDLFLFSDLVGSGLPLWTPKGTLLRTLLDEFVWQLRKQRGYLKVTIPHITKKELYITSGHWAKYVNDLFKITTREGHEFAMKPMNCPHHTQIYAHLIRSYRDLPQRYAETTMVYRDEQTGELSGLTRVLCITQDDAHVFCRESQFKEEAFKVWDMINTFYGAFGFKLKVRLSLHDPSKFEKYIGTKEQWDFSESQLREMIKEKNVEAIESIGEAAFYGPKLDFMAYDSLGRQWQVATIQADRNMPERFDLYCINEKGEHERIVMIHAAIMGSIERFVSILIEHLTGKFPLWLSPEQVRILTIADRFNDYAETVKKKLVEKEIRATIDLRAETLNKKIREAELAKVNYIIVIGEKEQNNKTVNIRTRDNEIIGEKNVDEFLEQLLKEVEEKK